mgnify:CR=1 FL=1
MCKSMFWQKKKELVVINAMVRPFASPVCKGVNTKPLVSAVPAKWLRVLNFIWIGHEIYLTRSRSWYFI